MAEEPVLWMDPAAEYASALRRAAAPPRAGLTQQCTSPMSSAILSRQNTTLGGPWTSGPPMGTEVTKTRRYETKCMSSLCMPRRGI